MQLIKILGGFDMADLKDIHLGICPIGWRNDDVPSIGADNNLQQLLSDAKLAGYEGVEVGGFFPGPKELNYQCKLRDMKIAGQWFSSFIIRDGIEKACEAFEKHCQYLNALDAHIATVSEQTYSIQQSTTANIFTDKPHFTDEEWNAVCEGLNKYGEIGKKYGVKVAYHHHMGTGIQTKAETERLMAHTDPDKVGLVFDTGHIFVSDGEVMPMLNEFIDRVVHFHFKDVREKKMEECKAKGTTFQGAFMNDMFTVPGDGCIDYRPIFKTIMESNYKGWIMVEAEQDPKKHDPLEMALKAHKYMTGILDQYK